MSIPITDIYIWMLVLCRCCGLLAGFPFGGENNGVPNTVKILMACAISYITLTVVKLDIVVPNAI